MKMGLSLAAAGVIGTAVGFGMPMEQSAPAPATLTAADLPALREQTGPGDDIVLTREGDGHFYADVQLDMVPTRMLVDTGASMIALTEADAIAAGLYWDEAELATVAQGASGAVRGVYVTLPRVSLGGVEMTNAQAVVIPEGLPVSLLGQSFLAQVGKVSIEGNAMVLSQ